MRDIRSRIAQRQGIDLSTQQIQDLAARKLESILDPRAIRPSLVESLRRGAGRAPSPIPQAASSEPVYTFEDTTIYDSHRGILRFIRRLFNPLLKLFFNPNPIIRALHLQAKLNVEAAAREAERERRQMEWNALHYEIVQRLVTEVSRLSIDIQAQATRVDSLAARVDFNDRRVRSIEGIAPQPARPAPRPVEPVAAAIGTETVGATEPAGDASTPEGTRRRRRRRRGRRGSPGPIEGGYAAPQGPEPAPVQSEGDASDDREPEATSPAPERAAEPEPPPTSSETPVDDPHRSEQ
jgi:hypothetical protein